MQKTERFQSPYTIRSSGLPPNALRPLTAQSKTADATVIKGPAVTQWTKRHVILLLSFGCLGLRYTAARIKAAAATHSIVFKIIITAADGLSV